MAHSVQVEVSNGTLQYIEVRLEYFSKAHIHVFVEGAEIPNGNTATGYWWLWDGDRIKLNVALPAGLEVTVRRTTPIDNPFHIFRQGAVFRDLTVDENFRQQLYINQENFEGRSGTDIYNDMNHHGYRITSLANAVDAMDAMPFSQYMADSMGTRQQRIMAEEARNIAATKADDAFYWANQSQSWAGKSQESANASQASATASKASADTAHTHAQNAGNSAADSAGSAAASSASADSAEESADRSWAATQLVDSVIQSATIQADRANREADRAKKEADRAEAASGTVTGDVVAKLLPAVVEFPDVWIPFNDSLNMLAGFGNEQKIGNILVGRFVEFSRASSATYIDKSGNVRTVGANEARFEREGLLIEGASTNLAVHSNKFHDRVENGAELPVQSNGWVTVPTGGGAQLRVNTNTAWSPNTKITLSVFMKGTGTATLETSIYAAFTEGGSAQVDLDKGIIAGVSKGFSATIKRIGIDVFRVSLTGTTNASELTHPNRGVYVNNTTGTQYVCNGQIELLPLMSSYIPTSGTVASRAAEYASIQPTGNMPRSANVGVTFAYQLHMLGTTADFPNPVICSNNGARFFGVFVQRAGNEIALRVGGGSDAVGLPCDVYGNAIHHVCAITPKGVLKSHLTGTGLLRTYQGTSDGQVEFVKFGDNGFFGHVRNFRVWHKALSDAQMKLLK